MASESTVSTRTGPSPPGMPSPPTGDFFNDTQWTVLFALLDAIIPSITTTSNVKDDKAQYGIPGSQFDSLVARAQNYVAEPPSTDDLEAYLADRPSIDPEFIHGVRRILSSAPSSALLQLGAVLTALSTRPGSLILTGYVTPLQDQPVHIREVILQGWNTSWFETPRVLFKTFTVVAKAVWLQTNPSFKSVTGYPDVPINWKAGKTEDFGFLYFGAGDPAVIDTDVVIVGSGCGGGVAAKILAEAGHRVLVVDKGHYFPPEQLPMPQDQGAYHLYENNGVVNSVDSSINIVAGSCWGGGGSVNWSVCLQTQGFVRREWAEEHGLPFFETAEYQACLDRVCDFMGATDKGVKQSHRGQVLLDGARKLGWDAKACPQNSGGQEHRCGHCHLGCGSGEKQGPAVSWLPAAAKSGAEFIEGFTVDKILFDEMSGQKAVGVVGTWTSRDANGSVIGPVGDRTSRRVVINAKKVIVSAGTLNSPLVLMKSGLKNTHIGRNLHLHPVNFIGGYFEEDAKPWEGGIITSVCTSFENLDGYGHGSKLEATCMLPYAFLSGMPWRSGLDFKLDTLRYRHLAGYISLARDRDTGRVYPNSTTGKPTVDYTPSPFDAGHALEGLIGLAKILYISGATEIRPFLPGVEPFFRAAAPVPGEPGLGVTSPEFVAWLATIRAAGNKPPMAPFTSAHQMGTCRMSSHPGAGVVDPKGRVWERENLYVADASVFPSASGVNPMITAMAIADMIARGVASELKGK